MNPLLSDVPQEQQFLLHEGGRLKSMRELARAFKAMPGRVFSHHVNEHRNDFANWIQDCILDRKLAGEIRACRTSRECQAVITRRMQELNLLQQQISKGALGEESIFDIIDAVGKERLKRPGSPQELDKEDNLTVQEDLHLLSSGISEQSFLNAYFEGNFVTNVEEKKDLADILERIESQPDDSWESLKLWADRHAQAKQGMRENRDVWKSNFVDLPIFRHTFKDVEDKEEQQVQPGKSLAIHHFMHLVKDLRQRIEAKDAHAARHLFQFIKAEFEKAVLKAEEKRSLHAELNGLFHEIRAIQP